mmetsp:Transcript_74140/g.193037  ORF Transcript_74140/g.193037 Transcript_74140/m.193037 type:complete len:215 (-) Transcript_74140:629-1273(-)
MPPAGQQRQQLHSNVWARRQMYSRGRRGRDRRGVGHGGTATHHAFAHPPRFPVGSLLLLEQPSLFLDLGPAGPGIADPGHACEHGVELHELLRSRSSSLDRGDLLRLLVQGGECRHRIGHGQVAGSGRVALVDLLNGHHVDLALGVHVGVESDAPAEDEALADLLRHPGLDAEHPPDIRAVDRPHVRLVVAGAAGSEDACLRVAQVRRCTHKRR